MSFVEDRGRKRAVPVPAWVKNAIVVWRAAAQVTQGRIFRSIGKGGRLSGGTLAEVGVWWLVKEYAEVSRCCRAALKFDNLDSCPILWHLNLK